MRDKLTTGEQNNVTSNNAGCCERVLHFMGGEVKPCLSFPCSGEGGGIPCFFPGEDFFDLGVRYG